MLKKIIILLHGSVYDHGFHECKMHETQGHMHNYVIDR